MEAALRDSQWQGLLQIRVMRGRKLCKVTSQGQWPQVSLKLSKMLYLVRVEAIGMRGTHHRVLVNLLLPDNLLCWGRAL
jgi:hypothetical protein